VFFCFGYTNIRFFGRIISLEDCKTDGIVVEALIEEGADKVDDMLGQLHSGSFSGCKGTVSLEDTQISASLAGFMQK